MAHDFKVGRSYPVDEDLKDSLRTIGKALQSVSDIREENLIAEKNKILESLWIMLFKRYPALVDFIYAFDWVHGYIIILEEAPPQQKEKARKFLTKINIPKDVYFEVDKSVCYYCGKDMSNRKINICKACNRKVEYKGIDDADK